MQATSQSNENSWRSRATWLAKLACSAALLAYCLSLIAPSELAGQFGSIDFTLVVAAFVINFLGTIVSRSFMIWRLASGTGENVSLMRIIAIHLGLRFYTLFLPRAVVVGIRLSKYRAIIRSSEAFALLSLDMIVSLLFLSAGTLGFSWFGSLSDDVPEVRWIALTFTLALVVILAILFAGPSIVSRRQTTDAPDDAPPGGLLARLYSKWIKAVGALRLAEPGNIFVVIGAAATNYALFLFSAYLLSESIGLGLPFWVIAWVRSAILLAAHLPIAIAGLGVREIGFISFFGLYLVSPESALAYAMLSFAVQIGIGFVGGMIEAHKFWSPRERSDEK